MKKKHRSSLSMATVAPILGVVALTLLVGAAAAINLHRTNTGVEASTAKPGHHMASLGEINALMQKARDNANQ